MTQREPDRYELAPDALERIAKAFEANPTAQHSGAAVASILRYLARASPAAAPAADPIHEAYLAADEYWKPPSEPAAPAHEPCQRCGKLGGHPVDFRFDGILMGSWICPHCLDAQEKRIAELETVLRKLIAWSDSTPVKSVTMSAWIHGVKFKPEDVAVWDEARAKLAARAAPHAKGEGKT